MERNGSYQLNQSDVPSSASFARQALTTLLDSVLDPEPARAHQRLDALLYGFDLIKRLATTESWAADIEHIRKHRAFASIHRTALNRRAFEKPRGYAGDAVTIDMIYGIEPFLDTDPWVRAVHDWGLTTAACRAVNIRREIIAAAIEETTRVKSGAAILSVACGHARELDLIDPDVLKDVDRFVCLDQDGESLERIQLDHVGAPVEVIEGSVLDILRGRVEFDKKFDLIYAAGLYDYLDSRVARALTTKLVGNLANNGRLLVANFAATIPDIAYMEAIMDWNLVYRSDEEMLALAPLGMQKLNRPQRQSSSSLVWLDLLLAEAAT